MKIDNYLKNSKEGKRRKNPCIRDSENPGLLIQNYDH
jgi:hypothetical protein